MLPNEAVATRIGDADRVRRSTATRVNEQIDREIEANIQRYADAGRDAMLTRIEELDKEWDIEQTLEVNASSVALTGIALGVTVDRRWLALPAVVLAFLFQHGIQGWCPPLPLLRRLGFRTRGEIEREKYGLKALLS